MFYFKEYLYLMVISIEKFTQLDIKSEKCLEHLMLVLKAINHQKIHLVLFSRLKQIGIEQLYNNNRNKYIHKYIFLKQDTFILL